MLGTILDPDKGRTSTHGPEEKNVITMHKALHPKNDIDYICQTSNEEEDSPVLKIASLHQYKDSKNTLESVKED